MSNEEFKKELINLIHDIKQLKNDITGLSIKKHNVSIILTSTVNVISNIDCCFQRDRNDRIATYLRSIRQWLEKTNLHITLVENSGYNFPELDFEKEKYKDRFEVISFIEDQQNDIEYLKDNGSKGYHELCQLQYAYKYSKFTKQSKFIIKITARFFIPQLEEYLKEVEIHKYDAMRQNQIHRCEMIGVNHLYFSNIFNPDLTREDGTYEGVVEFAYQRRLDKIQNLHICKLFPIEPTQRGGLNECFNAI